MASAVRTDFLAHGGEPVLELAGLRLQFCDRNLEGLKARILSTG